MALLAPLGSCHRPAGAVTDIRHVVVLVLDGVRMDESFGDTTSSASGGLTADMLPEVRAEILPEGALVKPAWNTGVTITGPAHCALLTGARQAIGNFPVEDGLGRYVPDLPTLFELLSSGGHGRGALIANTGLMEVAGHSAWPGLGEAAGPAWTYLTADDGTDAPDESDADVLDAAWAALRDDGPPLLVANLHAMDRAGHTGPIGEYVDRIEGIDGPLVDFYRRLQRHPSLRDSTLLVLVADHGRHSHTGEPEEWRGHGDSCSGCRSIPLFFAGPGVRKGVTIDGGYTLEDAGATLAWVLGTPLPYAQGRPITAAFDDPPPAPAGPSGVMDVDTSGTVTATSRWTVDGPTLRSEVTIDGSVVSTPGALRAEAPVVVSSDAADVVCWRELMLPEGALSYPWMPQCRYRAAGGTWEALALPFGEVSPLWVPGVALESDGTLWLAQSTNTSATIAEKAAADSVDLYRYRPSDGWALPEVSLDSVSYTTGLSVSRAGGHSLVAFATSIADDTDGRNSRHEELWEVDGTGADQVWTKLYAGDDGEDEGGDVWDRRESPVIGSVGPVYTLASLAYGPTGTTVLVTRSEDAGATWTAQRRLDDTGRVLTAVPLRWRGNAVYWARLSAAGDVEVCRATPEDEGPTCTSTGRPRVFRVAPTEAGVTATVDEGEGAWAAADWAL